MYQEHYKTLKRQLKFFSKVQIQQLNCNTILGVPPPLCLNIEINLYIYLRMVMGRKAELVGVINFDYLLL